MVTCGAGPAAKIGTVSAKKNNSQHSTRKGEVVIVDAPAEIHRTRCRRGSRIYQQQAIAVTRQTGVGSQVSALRFQVSGFRFQVSGFRFQVSGSSVESFLLLLRPVSGHLRPDTKCCLSQCYHFPMPAHLHRGKFITLEGLDGCGKSTQAERLAAVLREQG